MAGAPQNRGGPRKRGGVPRPLLLLCLLPASLGVTPTPSCREGNDCTVPPPPPPSRVSPTPLTVVSDVTAMAAVAPGCDTVTVAGVPPSRTAVVGDKVTLECRFRAPPNATVTWYRVCPRRNCAQPRVPVAGDAAGDGTARRLEQEDGRAAVTFLRVTHNDSGLYFCRVEAARAAGQSCGTFLRVREPVPAAFIDIEESTKNRIITGEGVLLLLCAAGPGLLLLFRKRWANERLLQTKKAALEEENLYEGLNLDECSMYEDISRGLQPTYQDVGSLQDPDTQLEKP